MCVKLLTSELHSYLPVPHSSKLFLMSSVDCIHDSMWKICAWRW